MVRSSSLMLVPHLYAIDPPIQLMAFCCPSTTHYVRTPTHYFGDDLQQSFGHFLLVSQSCITAEILSNEDNLERLIIDN